MASTGWMAFAASMMIIFGALNTLVYSGLVNFEIASDSVMLCKVKSWGKETISEMQGDMVCKGTVVKKTPELNIPISPLWQIFFHFFGNGIWFDLVRHVFKVGTSSWYSVCVFCPRYIWPPGKKHIIFIQTFPLRPRSSGNASLLFRPFISSLFHRKFSRRLSTKY